MSLTDTNVQPAPKPNANKAVWDLVLQDMLERDKFGESKYGTRLQAFNGRDVLADAYQEALDLVVYLRTAIYERDNATVKQSLTVEPAAAIDDESPRIQAIGQNGNTGEHYDMGRCGDCSAEHCPCIAR